MEFDSSPDWAKPDLLEWFGKVRAMSDWELSCETQGCIYDSALANKFRGNWNHTHMKATVCYDESQRRLREAGHEKGCHGPTLYSEAHARVMRDHGYTPTADGECHCGVS